MTIRFRLLLWHTSVLAVTGLALVLTVYLVTARQMRKEVDRFLRDQTREWLRDVELHAGDDAALARMMQQEVSGERYHPGSFRLISATGREVAAIGREEWLGPLRAAPAAPVGEIATVRVAAGGRTLRVLTARVEAGPYAGALLQSGLYTHRLNARLRDMRAYCALAFIGAVLVALAGGRFLAGRSLRPVDEIIADLERVESEKLSFRLPVAESRDEVERLRRAINRMLGRLQEAFEKVGGFTADAAHELRTPLAKLQLRLEVALSQARTPDEYRQVAAEALAETAHLTRMVNNLMFLARADARALAPAFETVSLRGLLADMQEPFLLAAEDRGLRLTIACAEACCVRGDPALLRRLFGNLVDNAIRYTPTGGTVRVTGAVAEGQVCVTVEDTGIGIAPEAQERIFERFFRTDESRSREAGGAGLGLNICRSIADLHGATITVQSAPGKGSTFVVRMKAV